MNILDLIKKELVGKTVKYVAENKKFITRYENISLRKRGATIKQSIENPEKFCVIKQKPIFGASSKRYEKSKIQNVYEDLDEGGSFLYLSLEDGTSIQLEAIDLDIQEFDNYLLLNN